jgi:hypothetical protein
MLKTLIIFCFVLSSISAFASEVHLVSMKERLRISLWVDGIEQKSGDIAKKDSRNRLPVELESALRKL